MNSKRSGTEPITTRLMDLSSPYSRVCRRRMRCATVRPFGRNDEMVKRSAGAQLWLLAALTASSLDAAASLAESEPSPVKVTAAAGNAARAPRHESGTRLDHHIRVL